MTGVRVVVAANSGLRRAAMVRLLQDADLEVAGQAGDAGDLLRKVRAHRPDVAIAELPEPRCRDECARVVRAIRAELPGVGVLLISRQVETGHAAALLEPGAAGAGYLLEGRVTAVSRFTKAGTRRRGTWLGARPRGRHAPVRPGPTRSPHRRALRTRPRSARPDGRGRHLPRHRTSNVPIRARDRAPRHEHLRHARHHHRQTPTAAFSPCSPISGPPRRFDRRTTPSAVGLAAPAAEPSAARRRHAALLENLGKA